MGTEATNESAALSRQRYALDVRAGELRSLGFETASFDLVVSWHTLEHMRDPLVRWCTQMCLFFRGIRDIAFAKLRGALRQLRLAEPSTRFVAIQLF